MRQTLLAGGSTFAHLLSRGVAAAKKAEDEDEKPAAARAAAAEKDNDEDDDDEEEDDKKDKKDKAKAEKDDDSDEEKADSDEDDDEEEASVASRRRAKTADDEDEDDKKDAKASAARARERARCAAIFATTAAARRPDVAAHLAFGTDLTRSAAIDTLKAVARGERRDNQERERPDLRSRMAVQPRYEVGTETERPVKSKAETFAAQVKLADEKRRGLA